MKISKDPSCDSEGVNTGMGIEAVEDSPMTVPSGYSVPGPRPKEDLRSTKKRRLETGKENESPTMNQYQITVMVPESASFAGLPFDILEIILEQTGYLGDVVSVSRTCKVLRSMLKSQSASGLWKRMRNAAGMPDPSCFVSQLEDSKDMILVERFAGKEAEYASFVFSEGECEVCGSTSKRMFSSFALRLRLCGNNDCREKIKTRLEVCERDAPPPWARSIPTLETQHIIDPWGVVRYWPRCPWITRKDWIHDYSLEPRQNGMHVVRTGAWMMFCVALCQWRDRWQEGVRRARKRNDTLAKKFAKQEGWGYPEILIETSYGWFHDMKTKRREEITEEELEKMRPLVARELYDFKEKRDRKKMMMLRESNKKDIWKYYQKLMSQPENYPILPPFSLFLKLPSIKLLQSSDLRDAKVDVRTAVRSKGFLKTMIQGEVENWVEKTKRQMLEVIGGSTEWNSMMAARRMPHPVLRLNARWRCKLCNTVEPRYENDGCLDFAGVCRHQCKEKTKKKRGEEGSAPWDINNFVQDEQACFVLTSCLNYFHDVLEEPSETRKRIQEKYWLCTSCDPPLFVRAQNIAGHSHRHSGPMQIEMIEPHGIWSGRSLIAPSGVSGWLKQNSQGAKSWVNKANYGCHYCNKPEEKPASGKDEEDKVPHSGSDTPRVVSDAGPSTDVVMQDDIVEGMGANETKIEEGKKAAAIDVETRKKVFENKFDFNGLRSHLSSKHKIHQIRDEDFWCYKPIDTFKTDDYLLATVQIPVSENIVVSSFSSTSLIDYY